MIKSYVVCIFLAVLAAFWPDPVTAKDISSFTSLEDFKHITFKGIPPTKFAVSGSVLTAEVNKSSSALLRAFEKPKSIERVSFVVAIDGKVNVDSLEHQRSKEGDDFLFRLGIFEEGPRRVIPMFAPGWIRAIRDHLNHPVGKLWSLVVGSKAPPEDSWVSPYSSSIVNIATPCQPIDDGLKQKCSYRFKEPVTAVGYWMMSDGDDTDSKFGISVSELDIQ